MLTHGPLVADEAGKLQKLASAEVDVKSLPSAALARLVEEVRNEKTDSTHSYDRAHNRHNR